ncbi:MAG: hypothetical protein JRI23_36445 [Deltaproteobacteria bacterium]|jgi:hypothetical protein|nr:hypothetical protein [Deltaproteobacteria bacterium]
MGGTDPGGGTPGGTGPGGAGGCAAIPAGAPFPSTGILDGFNRPDGPLGGTWVGEVGHYGVEESRLKHAPPDEFQDSQILYGATLCPDQEVYVTLTMVDHSASNFGLHLKVQDLSKCEEIEVDYITETQQIEVWTCAGGVWTAHPPHVYHPLNDGQQFGARATASGQVEVYVDLALVNTVDVSSWVHGSKPGRVGLAVWEGGFGLFDDFGGG